jgi:hypothetical protein
MTDPEPSDGEAARDRGALISAAASLMHIRTELHELHAEVRDLHMELSDLHSDASDLRSVLTDLYNELRWLRGNANDHARELRSELRAELGIIMFLLGFIALGDRPRFPSVSVNALLRSVMRITLCGEPAIECATQTR